MTRCAIDSAIAMRIVVDQLTMGAEHSLVGPAVLRSHALQALYSEVRADRLDEKGGRRRLEALAAPKLRLLNDRVSRATAWRLAARFDGDDTALAEYLAVASLDALVN